MANISRHRQRASCTYLSGMPINQRSIQLVDTLSAAIQLMR